MNVLALIGLALGVVVLVAVVLLFQGILRALLEIDRYAKDILVGGVGIATNLDGADQIVRTHELVGAVPDLAGAYLTKLGAGSS